VQGINMGLPRPYIYVNLTGFQLLRTFILGSCIITCTCKHFLESGWNVMAHGDTREGKWRGNRLLEWVASTLHTTSEHGVSSITTADAHTSAAGSRLNWPHCQFKWTRPFRRKTKSGFCACAITFQTQPTVSHSADCKECHIIFCY